MKAKKWDHCGVRVLKADMEAFKNWCEKADTTPSEVLREVIEAIPEGRVKITKKENQNLKELYHETN